MHITLTTNEIAHHLINDDNAIWTRKGAFALAEYLQEIEESNGESMELDLVAIRCDFCEYESLEDFCEDYFGSMGGNGCDERVPEFDNTQDLGDWLRNYIEERSEIIDFDGGLIIRTF